MFETLESPDRPVQSNWPIFLFYGIWCLDGVVSATISVREHGLSEPTHPVLSGAIFFLSLVWFVAGLRSGTPISSRKKDGFRIVIIIMLLFLGLKSLSMFT